MKAQAPSRRDSDIRYHPLVGTLGYLDIKMKVARALSFEPSLLARLARLRSEDRAVAEKLGVSVGA